MGWQEDQAARAREHQRQTDQRAASARQAEAIRQENETRNRQQRQRANDEMFAANAERARQHKAREHEASDKRHADFMARARRDAQSAESAPSWSTSSRKTVAAPVSNSAGSYSVKKKGKGGWLFLFLIIGIVYAVGHSGSSNSASSSQSAPIVGGPSRPYVETKPPADVPDTAASQTKPVDPSPTDQGAAATTDESKLTELPDTVRTARAPFSAPSSNLLEPLSRPGAYYPAAALPTRAQGEVIVVVGVQTSGTVSSATAASGDPVFVPAALEAARRWTFKPYPYEPGTSVRTMRISFQFVPPADYTLPANNGTPANYTLPANGGLGPG